METGWKAGLEDVIAARSGICQVDGERGSFYRGYEIADLASALSFEDVTALLGAASCPPPPSRPTSPRGSRRREASRHPWRSASPAA
jgi:citrate synthase